MMWTNEEAGEVGRQRGQGRCTYSMSSCSKTSDMLSSLHVTCRRNIRETSLNFYHPSSNLACQVLNNDATRSVFPFTFQTCAALSTEFRGKCGPFLQQDACAKGTESRSRFTVSLPTHPPALSPPAFCPQILCQPP